MRKEGEDGRGERMREGRLGLLDGGGRVRDVWLGFVRGGDERSGRMRVNEFEWRECSGSQVYIKDQARLIQFLI